MALGEYDQARQSFQKAVDEHPDIALGYVALAQAYMRDGKDADAAKLLADVRGKLPADAMVEYVYGLTLSHLSQRDEAIVAFQRSVTLDPKVAESHYELGKLYFQLGQIRQAREEFESVLAIAPEHAMRISSSAGFTRGLGRRQSRGRWPQRHRCFCKSKRGRLAGAEGAAWRFSSARNAAR